MTKVSVISGFLGAGKTTFIKKLLDEARGQDMQTAILAAAAEGDSVGGVLETAILGMPQGVGEPWFDSVEGLRL